MLGFTCYLDHRKQFVTFKELNSPPLTIKCGSILGPLLFLIYINDLSNVSNQLSKILFADNTSLFFPHRNPNVIVNVVNEELDKISKWFKTNKLSLNIKKTNFILLSNNQKKFDENITVLIDNVSITNVDTICSVGLLIDLGNLLYLGNIIFHLFHQPHILLISSKFAKNIGIIGKICFLLNTKVSLTLHYSMIYPFISSCNIAWASTHQTKLQPILKLQKRAMRIIAHSAPRSHVLPLFRKFGIYQINSLQITQSVYSSLNKTLPTFFHNFFSLNNQFHNYMTRNASQLRPPQSQTTSSEFKISYR